MLWSSHPHTTLGSEGKLTSQDAQEIESFDPFGSLCYLVFWVHWLFVEGLRCWLFPHNFWFGFFVKNTQRFPLPLRRKLRKRGEVEPAGLRLSVQDGVGFGFFVSCR